jgi:hypothetical protein
MQGTHGDLLVVGTETVERQLTAVEKTLLNNFTDDAEYLKNKLDQVDRYSMLSSLPG